MMEHGRNMTVTMYTEELLFKDGSTLIIQYDTNITLTLLNGCHNEHVTKVINSLLLLILKIESQPMRESAHVVAL